MPGRRYDDEMHLSLTVPALVIGLLLASAGATRADECGGCVPPWRSLEQGDDGPQSASRNAGVLEGRVVSVDREHGMMTIVSARGRYYDVVVLPSTNIQGHDGDFHTIADLERGQRVRVFMSQREGIYFAQFIHMHTEH
ncbi:MAG TPA: hypothetical protein VME66_02360 [Candidatus Acidoferrales bacterium]|nr:hypothetical protein [Candidatus Acidoferrales bacterium]